MKIYKKKYNVILDNMDINEYKIRPISVIMYLQDAFARYCATKRVAAYDLFPKNMYWIVTEFNIDFINDSPFWSEEIEVNIWISELTKLKIYTDYEILHKGKPFAKGNALWFLIDKNTKRPLKTDIISDRFEICENLVLGEHKKFSLPEAFEKCHEIVHINNLSDLDFNQHVNNKSYINLAEMATNDDFKKTHKLESLSIRFNKETFLGDKLTCSTYSTDKENVFINKIEKSGISICDILTSWILKGNEESISDYNLEVKNEV